MLEALGDAVGDEVDGVRNALEVRKGTGMVFVLLNINSASFLYGMQTQSSACPPCR